ncbi:winged helix-turn-helix domain-containing protein [Thermoproteota archaeon]
MNRSKLQICTEILCNLASKGPMNLSNLSERVNLKETQLKQYLKLLNDSALVTNQNFGKNKIFFIVTDSGITVLKMFRPPITEANETQINKFKAMTISL